MKTKPLTFLLTLTFLFLFSGSSVVFGQKEVKQKIKFLEIEYQEKDAEEGEKIFEIEFKKGPEESGVAIFKTSMNDIYTLIRLKDDKSFELKIDSYFRIDEIGTIKLSEDGYEDIFWVFDDSGSSFLNKNLYLFSTSKKEVLSLYMSNGYINREFDESKNYNAPHLKTERKFLENIKYSYGYLDLKDLDNPKIANHLWLEDNGQTNNGILKIRKYKGQPPLHNGARVITLKDGTITYTAGDFHGSRVTAYDKKKDEFYVLLVNGYRQNTTVMKKLGNNLIIGTWGDGIAIINTQTFQIKRLHHPKGETVWNIKSIDIQGTKIIVNDNFEITLSGEIITK
jgi:hypothetical protein